MYKQLAMQPARHVGKLKKPFGLPIRSLGAVKDLQLKASHRFRPAFVTSGADIHAISRNQQIESGCFWAYTFLYHDNIVHYTLLYYNNMLQTDKFKISMCMNIT